ncbi:MAG: hypothetical protein CMJ81_04865 [Planctomycetaceae bacterium]|nr:hypothetical protein [Planctomycetaceae bacterium]MBP61165.1 hypothetical protein [Planctomycetaceae bacterium]
MASNGPTQHRKCFRSPGILWTACLLAVLIAAGCVSIYLLQIALLGNHTPAGCGPDSGCAKVLASRWSVVGGVPVSAPAIGVYLSMLCGTLLTRQQLSLAVQQFGWSTLIMLAVLITLTSGWFLVLQHFVLQEVCTYCMAAHGLNLTAAGLIFLGVPGPAKDSDPETGQVVLLLGKPSLWALAALVCGLLILSQVFSSPPRARILRLPPGDSRDDGSGQDRRLSWFTPSIQIAPRDEPLIGSPQAAHILGFLFDYYCPHCRQAHQQLAAAQRKHANQLAFVLLPVPLDSKCNPTLNVTQLPFKNSCETALLALALWQADPLIFPIFDSWLIGQDTAPGIDEVRAKANELVPDFSFRPHLLDPSLKDRVLRNIQLYEASGAPKIPVICGTEIDGIVGGPAGLDELLQILEPELKLNGT